MPGKNLAMLGGYHLIEWTVNDAINSNLISDIYVSTDSERIAGIVEHMPKVTVIERPAALCTPVSASETAIEHVLSVIAEKPDIIVMMQCTSPFRMHNQLDTALRLFMDKEVDSLFFGCKLGRWIWNPSDLTAINYDPESRVMTQSKQWELVECGDYIFTRDIFERTGNRLGGQRMCYKVGKICSYDIDTAIDLEVCRAIASYFHFDARR